MLIQVDHRLQAVVVALAVVCIISILGSFCSWLQASLDGPRLEDNGSRWKWMTIVTLLLTTIMLITV